MQEARRFVRPMIGGFTGVIGGGTIVSCGEKDPPHVPLYPFYFKAPQQCFDVPSVRRGYEVYRQVCSTCHGMKQIYFRHLTNEVLPLGRVKEIAASYDIQDGPNDEGEMFMRPGNPTDAFPNPYPNEEAARYSNGGALPPDLSNYAACKHDGPEYIMSILLGYCDPPAGVQLRSGLYYNTYMAGGAIAMPPPLEDGMVEYEDGTIATCSQMAHDVCHFITWATDPVIDEKKLQGMKFCSGMLVWWMIMTIWKNHMWSQWKTYRIDFKKAVLHLP